jgi:hypothetical protein
MRREHKSLSAAGCFNAQVSTRRHEPCTDEGFKGKVGFGEPWRRVVRSCVCASFLLLRMAPHPKENSKQKRETLGINRALLAGAACMRARSSTVIKTEWSKQETRLREASKVLRCIFFAREGSLKKIEWAHPSLLVVLHCAFFCSCLCRVIRRCPVRLCHNRARL